MKDTTRYTALFTTLLLFTTLTVAQSSTQIDVELKNTEPTPLQSSEYADIWLEVTNEGNNAANDVNVTFNENYPFSVDPGDKKSWDIGELVPGEEYQIHLQARVDENAVQGDNSLDFTTSTGSVEITRSVPVEVRSDNNILSIEKFNSSETIAPGSSGQYRFRLENQADAHLKNIRMELGLSGSEIPVATESTSVQSFESVAPDESFTASFNLQADSSAENAVYKLPIDLNYENEAGTEFEDSVSTALNVGGEPELETGITNDEVLTPGRNTVNLRVVNRGYGTAGFVQATLQESEQYDILSPETVYLGEMTSDDYQTAEFEVYLEGEGNVSMPLRLDYSSDGEQTMTEEIEAEVYSQQQMERYGLSGGGSPLPLIVVVLVLAVGGVYYWRKRR